MFVKLVMEQSHAGEGHDHVVLIALGNNQVIADRAAGLGNIGNTGGLCPLDGVGKGEEGIAAQRYTGLCIQEGPLFLSGQGLRTGSKVILPNALSADILFVAIDVAVNHVVTAGAAQILPEGQRQGLGMLAQEPGISLAAGKTGAMNTGLLTGTYTDGLTVIGKANGVGLGKSFRTSRHLT